MAGASQGLIYPLSIGVGAGRDGRWIITCGALDWRAMACMSRRNSKGGRAISRCSRMSLPQQGHLGLSMAMGAGFTGAGVCKVSRTYSRGIGT